MVNYKQSKYNIVVDTDLSGRILLYNSVSGAVSWLNESIYRQILALNMTGNADELPYDLIRMGYLVPSEIDETGSLMFHRKCSIYSNKPVTLSYVIAPTLSCNFHCNYCYELPHCSSVYMDKNTWDDVYNFIRGQVERYTSVKRLRITWFGGEPCLVLNELVPFSKRIIQFAQEKEILYNSSIVTNGSLMDKATTDALYSQCNVKRVQVTLDGLSEKYAQIKGTNAAQFDKVIDNLSYATNYLDVRVRINVSKFNMDDVVPLIRYLLKVKELNGKMTVYLAGVVDYSKDGKQTFTPKEFELFRENTINQMVSEGYIHSLETDLPGKIATPCTSMRNYTCVIGPQGELYRCEHCLGMSDWIIGDVKHGFYHNDSDLRFLDYPLSEKCSNCSVFPLCAGGCVADKLLDGIPFDCESYMDKIKYNVKLAVYSKRNHTAVSEN